MGHKQKTASAPQLSLTTIVYRRGEWSPELLRADVRRRYQYFEIQEVYADNLKCMLLQKKIDFRTALYIAATEESLRAAQQLGIAALGYAASQYKNNKEQCVSATLSGVRTIVEGFEEVDACFLERVYEREHHLPWVIAETDRWILRELAMEDMDGLVELYEQPGVAYRIENGHKLPGYIEPLLPREEEEEYQRCYIENMYGFYGYGMWLVTDAKGQQIIGRAGLEHREYEDGVELEMGYVIDPRWQHRGIAYEVCSAIMEYAKENTGFERLNALTEADNAASIALLEKLGFIYQEDTDVSGAVMRQYVYYL